MGRSVCLICCYSFPEKRIRIISDDTREAFRKFCSELNIPLEDDRRGDNDKKKACGLDFPYGEDITICGDCLSLVVLYVQRRTVQSEKEDKVIELQKAVCAALKDLQDVVEEVQTHIEDLHCTIRAGDESCLGLGSFGRRKETNPRVFRANVLKLNTGLINAKTVQKDNDHHHVQICIKSEPREKGEETEFSHDGPYDDSRFVREDEENSQDDFVPYKVTETFGKEYRLRNNESLKNEESQPISEAFDDDDLSGFDDRVLPDSESDRNSNYSDEGEVQKAKKRKRKARSNLQSPRCSKRFKTPAKTGSSNELRVASHDDDEDVSMDKPSSAIDVVVLTNVTKTKTTYKIACPVKYTYSRRNHFKSGVEYYRCDYRAGLCSASICLKGGFYYRQKKGWNSDGTHAVHAPDVESTNRQIEVAKANAMYLSNPSISIDDVCNEMLSQSNGQLATSLRNLKRRIRYTKEKLQIERTESRKTKDINESSNINSNLEDLKVNFEQEASQWKDDLIGRIVMQMNSDIHDNNDSVSNSFEYVDDGKLKLHGILVNVVEKHQSLECTRCRRKYYEKRDATSENVLLENIMRDHILSAHINNDAVKVLKDSSPPIDCVLFGSVTTKNKTTYKLACPMQYTYSRKLTRKCGVEYYRCDYRAQRCSASICCKDGLYYRLKKGWNSDGSHSIHVPDVERTNRQILVAKAKTTCLTDSTKSVDEVCNEMLEQSKGELMIHPNNLRRTMQRTKQKRSGMSKEEKAEQKFPCPHCPLVTNNQGSLNRHIKSCRDKGPTASSAKSRARHKSATLLKKAKKIKTEPTPETEAPSPQSPGPSEAPSIVFNDPSVASNFVNKCITAIMQQVGVSVSGNDSVRPISSELHRNHGLPSTSTSAASSDNVPQRNNGPLHNSVVHSQQPSTHPGFPQHQNPSSSGHNPWPWNTQ